MSDNNFCQVEVEKKKKLICRGKQSHFKGQSPSQSSRLFKNSFRGTERACPVVQRGAMSKEHLIERCFVSVFDFRKVAFGS